MKTLPLVEDPAELWRGGGREQGGGERLDGHSEKTQETLFWDNQVFSNLEGVLETIREVLLTPHPAPLPQGGGEITFDNTPYPRGREI